MKKYFLIFLTILILLPSNFAFANTSLYDTIVWSETLLTKEMRESLPKYYDKQYWFCTKVTHEPDYWFYISEKPFYADGALILNDSKVHRVRKAFKDGVFLTNFFDVKEVNDWYHSINTELTYAQGIAWQNVYPTKAAMPLISTILLNADNPVYWATNPTDSNVLLTLSCLQPEKVYFSIENSMTNLPAMEQIKQLKYIDVPLVEIQPPNSTVKITWLSGENLVLSINDEDSPAEPTTEDKVTVINPLNYTQTTYPFIDFKLHIKKSKLSSEILYYERNQSPRVALGSENQVYTQYIVLEDNSTLFTYDQIIQVRILLEKSSINEFKFYYTLPTRAPKEIVKHYITQLQYVDDGYGHDKTTGELPYTGTIKPIPNDGNNTNNGTMPNRSDYAEGIIGSVQYGFDTLFSYIQVPFKLIGQFITNLISWLTTSAGWITSINTFMSTFFTSFPPVLTGGITAIVSVTVLFTILRIIRG